MLALAALCFCQATMAISFTDNRYDAFKTLKIDEQSIVFMGNSITNSHEWTEAFGRDPRVVCRGVGSAKTSDALNNIENVIMGHPAKLFLMLGVNDVFKDVPLGTAFANMKSIVDRCEKESPNTEIYIESVLPTCGSSYGYACVNIEKLNAMYKSFVEEHNNPKLKYIDLYNLMLDKSTGMMVTDYTYDGCHLNPNAYQIWCNAVAPYVGIETIYPKVEDGLLKPFSFSGYSGTHLARVNFFNFLPIPDESVLIFGDSFIESGEWAEFFHSNLVLNRGSGMGYNDLDLSQLNQSAPYIFHDKPCPKQIWICTSNKMANNSQSVSTFTSQLNTLISTIRNSLKNGGANTRIVLTSCLPSNNASVNTNYIVKYNAVMEEKANSDSNIDYVDVYTPLVNGSVANSRYYQDERLAARGYAKMAKAMESKIKEAIPSAYVVSEDKSDAVYDTFNYRTTLAVSLEGISSIEEGNDAGQFKTADYNKVTSLLDEGLALLGSDASLTDLQTYNDKLQTAIEEVKPNVGRPITTDTGTDHWYTMSTPQRGNYYATCPGAGKDLCGTIDGTGAASQWKFEDRPDGSYNIINRKYGCFIVPNHTTGTSLTTSAKEPAEGWKLDLSGSLGLFIIHSGNFAQFNQTKDAGLPIYNWYGNGYAANNTVDQGCQYRIVPAEEPADITPVTDVANLADGYYYVKSTQEGLENYYVSAANTILEKNGKTYSVALLQSVGGNNAPKSFISVKKNGAAYDVRTAGGQTVTDPTVITNATDGLAVQNWGVYTADSKNYYLTEESGKNSVWQFIPTAVDFYDYYEVAISGEGAEGVQVSCSNSALLSVSKATDKGFFFFPKGTKVSSADFSAPVVGNLKPTFRVNASIHSVMCTYSTEEGTAIQEAYDALSAAVDAAVNAEYDESLIGPDPGFYSAEGIAALKAAIAAAQEGLKKDLSADEYNQLAQNLQVAIEGAQRNPIENGFYQIVCADDRFEISQGVKKAWYFWNATGWTCWVNARERDDRQIFRIEELPTEGQFSIQDVTHTKWYLDSNGKSSEKQNTPQLFDYYGEGQWVIRNTKDASAYHCLSHSSGAGQYGNLTMWENAAFDFGRWYLRRVVDADYLHHLEGFINGQQELLRTMRNTLSKASEAYDQATGTKPGEGLVTKASYAADSQLTTNMPQNQYGNIANLIDGKNSTWLMMVPDGKNADLPYVAVDLSASPVQNFYFKTATITQTSGAEHPTDIHLLVSDDNANWKEVNRYTTELPTTTNKEFVAKVMLDKAYKYLRFDFYENHTPTSNNQYNVPSTSPNISLGQLQIYPVATATAEDALIQQAANALNNQMAAAWELVRTETVTQEAIDALKGAVSNLETTVNPGSVTYDVELVNAPADAQITIGGRTYGNGSSFRTDKEITPDDINAEIAGYDSEVTVTDGVIRVVYSLSASPIELENMVVNHIGEKTTDVIEDQWYILTQTRDSETPVMDPGEGNVILREQDKTVADIFTANVPASEVAKYLIRFGKSGIPGAHRMQFATGNFFATQGNAEPAKKVAVVSSSTSAFDVLVNPATNTGTDGKGIAIASTPDGTTYGFLLDNDNKTYNHTLSFWSEGKITEGTNNVWYIYPVELSKSDAEQIARNKALQELIATAQATYDKNNNPQLGEDLIVKASQFSSPYSDSVEGKSFDALLDKSNATFWHTDWHSQAPEGPHYLQVDLIEPFSGDMQVTFTRRATDRDHVTLLGVQYSTDGQTYEEGNAVALPFEAKGETVHAVFQQTQTAVSFRFFAGATITKDGEPDDRGFWHVADFQLNAFYSATPLNDEHPTAAAALVQALDTARGVENASESDIADLQAAYDAYLKACQEQPEGIQTTSITRDPLPLTQYNIQGQRITTPARGINITEGHKTLVK